MGDSLSCLDNLLALDNYIRQNLVKRVNVVFKEPQEQNVKHDLLADQPKAYQSKQNVELIQKDQVFSVTTKERKVASTFQAFHDNLFDLTSNFYKTES